MGYELYIVGRYEEAQAALQKAQELIPQLSSLHLTRGKILFSQGRQPEALAEMENLKKLIVTHQNDCAYQIAQVYAYRGETDRAFQWLERAFQQRDPGTAELKTGPLMKSLRQDPRYAELLKKMRLPA